MSPIPGAAAALFAGLVFGSAVLLTVVVRAVARRRGWVAQPRADRWHDEPTAMHGGVGIFVPFFVACAALVLGWRGEIAPTAGPLPIPLPYALLVGALLMFLVGLLDDLYCLRPATKLVGQLFAANILVLTGAVLGATGFLPVDLLLTYLWFIGITNAVNMLDNMDGLASGIVIIALASTLFLVYVPETGGELSVGFYFGLALIAATLGFWVFNRPPASIFMGDSGALSLGYVLAALTMPTSLNGFLGVRGLAPVMTLIVPATVLVVPIFDTTLVTVTRQLRAQSPAVGGRDHSSHRLVGLGLSERGAVWTLYAAAAAGGALALVMAQFPDQSIPLFGFYALFLTLAGIYLGRLKIRESEPAAVDGTWTPLVTELFHKRRAAEVLLDLALIVLCFQAAHLLRFEGTLAPETRAALGFAYPIVVPSFVAAFFLMRIYRGRWRFITVADLPNYAGAVLLGTAVSLSAVTLMGRFGLGHSRSVYVIHALLLFLTLIGSRLSFRLFDNLVHRLSAARQDDGKTRVLIYGAGRGGKFLFDEMMYNDSYAEFRAIGFIDDDPDLWGQELSGVCIWALGAWLEGKERERIAEIWISSNRIGEDKVRAELTRLGLDLRLRRLVVAVSETSATEKLHGLVSPTRSS